MTKVKRKRLIKKLSKIYELIDRIQWKCWADRITFEEFDLVHRFNVFFSFKQSKILKEIDFPKEYLEAKALEEKYGPIETL